MNPNIPYGMGYPQNQMVNMAPSYNAAINNPYPNQYNQPNIFQPFVQPPTIQSFGGYGQQGMVYH